MISPSDLTEPASGLTTPRGHESGSWLPDPGPSPESRVLTEEARVQIRAAIDALPPSQRMVITMRDLEGYSSEEVCNVLGLSETNQRVILHRARSKVRDMVSAYFRRGLTWRYRRLRK